MLSGVLLGIPEQASAYLTGAGYTWDASTPNYNPSATIHTGTIDVTCLVMGDFLGVSASQPAVGFYGSSGAEVGWDDAWTGPLGDGNTNGDALDGLWVQIHASYRNEVGWWDLGAPSSRVVVFTSQDHGPYPGEGLEYHLYGTNTPWSTTLSPEATLTDVYLDGWRVHNSAEDANNNGWCSDDVAGVFEFDGAYRYVKLTAWSTTGGYSEPEVDALAAPPVPEASTLMLFGSGLSGLVFYARKKRLIKF